MKSLTWYLRLRLLRVRPPIISAKCGRLAMPRLGTNSTSSIVEPAGTRAASLISRQGDDFLLVVGHPALGQPGDYQQGVQKKVALDAVCTSYLIFCPSPPISLGVQCKADTGSPDKNPGVKDIQARFARLGVITGILRDPESRERYNVRLLITTLHLSLLFNLFSQPSPSLHLPSPSSIY